MNIRRIAVGVGISLAVLSLAPTGARAVGDDTLPFGQFGFTTHGLGSTGSYGEPSLAIAADGQHVVSSTPGCARCLLLVLVE